MGIKQWVSQFDLETNKINFLKQYELEGGLAQFLVKEYGTEGTKTTVNFMFEDGNIKGYVNIGRSMADAIEHIEDIISKGGKNYDGKLFKNELYFDYLNNIYDGKTLFKEPVEAEKEGWYGVNTFIDHYYYIDLVFKKQGEKLIDDFDKHKDYRAVGPYKTERDLIVRVNELISVKTDDPSEWKNKWGGERNEKLGSEIMRYLAERINNIYLSEPDGVMKLLKHDKINGRLRDFIGGSVRVDEIGKIDVDGGKYKGAGVFKSVYVDKNALDVFVLEAVKKGGKSVEVFQFNRDFNDAQAADFLKKYNKRR